MIYDIGNSIQNLSLQNNFKVSLQESSRYRQKSIQNIYLGVSLQNIVKDSLTKLLLIQLTAFKTFSLVQNIFKDLIPEVNEIIHDIGNSIQNLMMISGNLYSMAGRKSIL